METTVQRNALALAQREVEQGRIPAAKDLKVLEAMTDQKVWELLDKVDQLKQQKSHQATSQPIIDQSPPTQKVQPKQKSGQGFADQDLSDAGKSDTTTERKKPLTGREKDFYNFFDKRFGPFVVLILYLAMADLEKASFYAPSPAECHELAPHIARLGVKIEDLLKLPKWAHDIVVTSDDTFVVGMVVVGYLDRIGFLQKIGPWARKQSDQVRARRSSREYTQPKASNVPVQPGVNGRVRSGDEYSNPAIRPDEQFHVPLDQLGIFGVGEQYRAEP
jgi:hypothetical protein